MSYGTHWAAVFEFAASEEDSLDADWCLGHVADLLLDAVDSGRGVNREGAGLVVPEPEKNRNGVRWVDSKLWVSRWRSDSGCE